ncbi:RNA polymerase [Jatobal virus]|uniref:RNA-directed RNA polymerase L n=1 Tax=Jatobal virus TaxID=150058 RepID=M1F368_9VIRU|nr:RNA polymerase [Jatobal virus]AFI24668.1 RNA polymerase [Jatobal virus]
MSQLLLNQYRNRILHCREPEIAKDIWRDLLNDRHNYFSVEFCRAANLEHRNDVPAEDICAEVVDMSKARKVRFCTPDNYLLHDGKMFIIDFKVSIDERSSRLTRDKYNEIFGEIFNPEGIDYEVVIIRLDPSNMTIHIDSREFTDIIGPLTLNIDLQWFFDMKDFLFGKFRDDDKFHAIINQGEFTMTLPWIEEDTPELLTHPVYLEFMHSMPLEEQQLFNNSLNFKSFGAEKWNIFLKEVLSNYEDYYKKFIKDNAKSIFLTTGNYPKPDKQQISAGWNEMVARVGTERELVDDINQEKPSLHMIWSQNDSTSNNNIQKLIKLSKLLQSISGSGTYINAFRSLGKLMDISADTRKYEAFCNQLKSLARSSVKKLDRKIDPIQIGTSTVLWEQQFKLDTEVIKREDRIHLLKDFFGIGKHKSFNKKLNSDINLEKPKILNFNNEDLIRKCKNKYNQAVYNLSQPNQLDKIGNYLEHFSAKINNCSVDMWDFIYNTTKTRYWQCINDYSMLMKNMLAVSQYNRHNTFRIVSCANNNLFGLVMPSSDIKTKKATLVYAIIAIHNDEKEVVELGSLYSTFKTNTGYLSISKAFRLDKERCQRIVSSPGLFLMTSCLLFNGNKSLELNELLGFSFFTSVSITKAMLSLTEPSRYMIMNSLAVSSHVKEYISEKFSPYTKTCFSVIMTDLIKKGCYSAYEQRKKVQIRDIKLTDYDITQKGVDSKRDLKSIWFPGKVSLKEYLNQIYLPFYFNSKGLHEKHHVLIDLAKTILEIERDQRESLPEPWSEIPKKQTVNLKILIYSIAKNLNLDTSRHNFVRSRVENANNFNRSITTISTFTSSKSCIKIGDFEDLKKKKVKSDTKKLSKEIKKVSIANPLFLDEITNENEIKHSTYEDLKQSVPEYTDYMSVKVFDRLYEKIKNKEMEDSETVKLILETMKTHKTFYFGFFNKGQKTAKDREIFLGEFEAKMCLYLVERIAKERCKLNPEEMISEPGDSKLRVLEKQSEEEIRYISNSVKTFKNTVENLKSGKLNWSEIDENKTRGLKIEINADMSKWSAQDVLFKYFWLISLDPILYPAERKRILYFLCNYMQKKLILPDELLTTILDQRVPHSNDIIGMMTNNYRTNTVEIKRNWLQGNLNYTSSYLHSCSMSVYRDIIKEGAMLLEGEALVNSMVHSDDNQTSICMIQNKLSDDSVIEFCINVFEKICLTFGNQANMKKTYLTNFIKEFVSLFNIHGEPFSIYGRFLLTAVGDCAYLGPYEDLASRLSATQTAVKHGCPPSLAWLSIALNHWITHTTYNMLPGQTNDPLPFFPTNNRNEIPVEMCGLLESDLSTIALTGLESGNVTFLTNMARKLAPPILQRESIQDQYNSIETWDLEKLSPIDILKFKMLRYIALDSSVTSDDGMGETSEMRSRSLLTPRKFTTSGSLNRLVSYKDYQEIISDNQRMDELFETFIRYPELLVTKGENFEEFTKTILFRYNSKKFKESLSIQNPAQLFIEQILFSNKPVIDYTSIHDKMFGLQDIPGIEELDTIIGRKTFVESYVQIVDDLSNLKLDLDDIKTVYAFCLMNDPLLVTAANNIIMSVKGHGQERIGQSACKMPEVRSLKLIHYSPAIVLRAYVRGINSIPNIDVDELSRDLSHLEEFIKSTNLREHMRDRIDKNEKKQLSRDLKFEIKELTRFYQVCYDYVKSTEHKIKVFILPYKVFTSIEFCGALTGNLISDKVWYITHYLKNIVSSTHKAQISASPELEVQIADEALRLIAHFADTFLSADSRVNFLKTVVEQFNYKGIPVKHLYAKIKNSKLRTKFLGILLWLDDLTQSDLDKFDADKSDEKIIWNNWQVSRDMNTGPIDLIISGYSRQLRITGEDDRLIAAELQVTRLSEDLIHRHGQAMLNKPHGLKLEKMQSIQEMSRQLYYIVYQQRSRKRYFYSILPTQIIEDHNSRVESSRLTKNSKWVPVCPVAISKLYQQGRPILSKVKKLNMQTYTLSRIQVNIEEYAITRRAHFQKMPFFEGPPIPSGGIDLSELMKSTSLLSLNYDNIRNASLLDMSRVFKCNGSQNDQMAFEFLSDEVLEQDIIEEIECNPIFSISYTKKGDPNMTYKNAFHKALIAECDKFETAFDFLDMGFCSNENLSILEEIHWIISYLKTNQWSTELDNCIHMCMYRNGYDAEFHNFDIPSKFLKDPITRSINWPEVIEFILLIEEFETAIEPWASIKSHFCSKAHSVALESMRHERRSLAEFVDTNKKTGKSKFDF